ncbi:histidine kinase OS=Streptomyces aurantiogriseus OX=66870 GN=GCM10010251_37880 PE=4 SV=1 [Streptomyces aurantiogriseus]|uniref:histidine kinase n=1 Tax=Streptomyces aurantiogriseus TaxID=66870 RepID=A0A918FB63_9ACTN|nr:two-component sensor histidine kinase [Streptomyces aurantiogriseus]
MERWVRHPWADVWLAAGLAVVDSVLAVLVLDGRRPDTLGWALLLAGHVPLVWRRRYPVLVLCQMVVLITPYHALDYNHTAPIAPTLLALYTVAVTSPARRTLVVGSVVIGVTLTLNALTNLDGMVEFLRISGWIFAVLLFGGYIRVHRENVTAALDRAERAERTREEEARRRVAEERLRIARDLHDLLAHSITLIGVQTSVAAHVLAADPGRLDRAAVAQALDDIAETCRSARGELRTTLEVLRDPGAPETRGPLPGLHSLPDLAETARATGAEVELSVRREGEDTVPPAVGAAAYRIVQEALTNAVRHGGRDDLRVRVSVYGDEGALRVTVSDDGAGAGAGVGTPGFGLVGMRERARSVGGTLEAGPREGEGFEVCAVLPMGERR